MNKRLMNLLSGYTDLYPRRLDERFPHIVEVIVLLWGHAEVYRYFDKLVFSDRGNRSGFPAEAVQEILALRSLHERLFPDLQERRDVWADAPMR